MSRVFKILRSIQYRQSQRIDLNLLRAGFVFLATAWGMSATVAANQRDQLDLGLKMVWWFYPASVLFLAYLAGRINREAVGDTTSGYLSLIAMSGTSRSQWTVTRFIQNLIGFLSVWVVRIPFLWLFFTLGGVRLEEILFSELLLLFLYGAVTARSMIVAHNSDNRKSADWSGLGTIFFLEIMLNSGRILVTVLTLSGMPVPSALQGTSEILHSLSLQEWLSVILGIGVMNSFWQWNIVFYVALIFYWLLKYRRHVYDQIGNSPEPVLESKKEKKKALKKRPPLIRCWDDALAWQSYVYYAGGHDNTTGRVILYGVAFLFVIFCVFTKMLTPVMVIVLIGSGIVFLNAMNGMSHCFDKEVKAKTLGSLVMTPNDGLDFYRGWRKGILWLTIPDHVYGLFIALVMLLVEPAVSYVILVLILTIHLSGPLLMLSGLVPMNWKSLGVAFVVVFGLICCVAPGVFLAVVTHPAMFPLGFLPLYAFFNSLLLHQLVEKWLRINIDRQT